MERNYEEIYKKLRLDGFFSEYLPPCFKLEEAMFIMLPPQDCDLIQPCSFTMSRFNANDSRRTIYIPEICAYAVLNEYVKQNKIIEELTEFIDTNEVTFSKIIMDDSSIRKHEQIYGSVTHQGEKIKSQYIDNVVKKLIISAGAKKILKLDIANCFSSFYTHYIPAIIMGFDEAEKNYKKSKKREDTDEKYEKYCKLDKIIRKLNKNQTNGLLVGPIISKIIVEGLLTRIDKELENSGIKYTRYVDDYEVYLFEDNEDCIKNIFVEALKKYGLSLNYEKMEIIDFPYYVVNNFDRMIELYNNREVDNYDLIKLFNDFFEIERSGTKGAIRYLIKNLESSPINVKNNELFDSYILTVMSNDPRSLTKACSLLIENNMEHGIDDNYINQIKHMLLENSRKNYDLEVIWLLYLLIETNNIIKDEDVITAILESNNELAQLMILRKNLTDSTEKIKQNAKSWILNYELFASDIISINEFCDRLVIKKNKNIYEKLKVENMHFCYRDI